MKDRTKLLWLAAMAMLIAFVGLIPTRTALASTSSGGDSDFMGVITSLPGTSNFVGDWQVNLRTVHVMTSTQIITTEGMVAIGAFVEVTGVPQPDGSINATKIEVKAGANQSGLQAHFRGVVKSLPADPHNGDWVVTTQMMSGTVDVTVHVSGVTKITLEDGVTLSVGSNVQVEGLIQPDKSVTASEIDVQSGPPMPGKRIEFLGQIMSLPVSGTVGVWTVGTYTVNVSSTTHIDNDGKPIKVGDFANVEGILATDGSVNAQNIEIHHSNKLPPTQSYIKFYGDVTVVPTTTNHVGDWTVNSITVHVSTTTKIDFEGSTFPTVPFRAEVKGILNSDGSVTAIQIEIDSSSSSSPRSGLGRASAVSRTTK